jgi:hypothetical protein
LPDVTRPLALPWGRQSAPRAVGRAFGRRR